ncbi:hypothetical protein [Persephonella sp.]
MKVEGTGLETYKSILELQKKLVDMMIQQNLQTDNSNVNQSQNTETPKSSVEGTKVSIYA